MSTDVAITLSVIVGTFSALFLTKKEPEMVLLAGLMVLILAGILPVDQALIGFSSPGLFAVAAMFVVAGAIQHMHALEPLVSRLMHGVNTSRRARLRILFPVSVVSSLINNTTIVAALIPEISRWAKTRGIAPSKLLLPLSYSAILGGTWTLIGTSTNLIVYGLLQAHHASARLGFFDLAVVGIPITVTGWAYMHLMGERLLPDRRDTLTLLNDVREYTVEMEVDSGGWVAGKTITEAGLRNLQGLYLIEIIRDDFIMAAAGPEVVLHGKDRLVFTGDVSSIGQLVAIKGLSLPEEKKFRLTDDSEQTLLVEAVIGPRSPVVGKTVKELNFRRRFDAGIIAIVRDGERIRKKVGDIRLKAGDHLLLLAKPSFVDRYRDSNDFLLLQSVDGPEKVTRSKVISVWATVAGIVLATITDTLSLPVAALCGALFLLATNTIDLHRAREHLDLQILAIIGLAYGLGEALKASGTANWVADVVVENFGHHPFILLVVIYLLTSALTETITNSAAAVIAFSVTQSITDALGYSILPFAVAIMIAASASFVSPLGYQTNLMVYGAGGYTFSDYLRFGAPLALIVAAVSLMLIPFYWPLLG